MFPFDSPKAQFDHFIFPALFTRGKNGEDTLIVDGPIVGSLPVDLEMALVDRMFADEWF